MTEIMSHDTQTEVGGPADCFTGRATIRAMFGRDEPSRVTGAIVTFEPGARSNWHTHPRRKKADYKRWERSRAMELWQMDVAGGVMLADGWRASIVSGIDDHSRFVVSAHVVQRATARPTCGALMKAMRSYRIPAEVLTDNGKVFTGRFGPAKGEVLFDRDLLRERDPPHSDRARVADNDGQSRAVAQDVAPRVPRHQGLCRHRRRPGPARWAGT